MELLFVSPQLRALDLIGSEVLACGLFENERPIRGMAGLLDWRFASRLSHYLRHGEITASLGELVLLPGKPRIPFEKLLLFGLGPLASFDEAIYAHAIEHMLRTLSGLRVRMAVVERPGRHLHCIDPVRGVDLLLEASAKYEDQDTWTLIEEVPDHKVISQHLAEERRRRRGR